MDTVELAIRMTADADDATRALDSVGDAAGRMASDVDSSMAKADAASGRMDSVADSADNMASRSSQAAGGLGDLGGALSALPGPLGALGAGMEATAPAIMGVTGAADLMNLVTTSSIVTNTRAAIASGVHRAALIGQRAASLAAAAGTRVLNAAMRANPIGLAVTAITLLVAGLVLAYRRSETFRRIVNAVFSAVRSYVMAYIRVIMQVVNFFRTTLPAAAGVLRDRVVAVWTFIRDRSAAAWDAIRDKVAAIVGAVRDRVAGIRDTIANVADAVRDKLGAAWDYVLDKLQPLIDKVQWLVDKVQSIDLPDLPGFRTAATPTTTATTTDWGTSTVTINLPLLSALDSTTIARLIAALDAWYAAQGLKVKLVPR